MLQNSGPYGPNDTPVNMGNPVNMPPMTTPINIGHNLNNLVKMPQQLGHTASGHYNLPDYSAYSHSQLSNSPQIPPFPTYNALGYQSPYLLQNPSLMHDTSWQSAPQTTSDSNYSPNVLNYPVSYERTATNETLSLDMKEQAMFPKIMPLNIPQVHSKTFQKQDNLSSYGYYNENQEKTNYYNQHLDLTHKSIEKPLLDINRRKSLENTVRLIENILINSSKNSKEVTNESQDDNTQNIVDENSSKKNEIVEQNSMTVEDNETDLIASKAKNPPKTQDANQIDPLESSSDTSKHNDCTKKEIVLIKNEKLNEDTDSESMDDCEGVQSGTITIKVEPLCWSDSEDNPFQRDIHGINRNDVLNDTIVDYEVSVEEAGLDAKNAETTSKIYECPYCNLLIQNPKRFLIHTKWHNFGLTNNKRIELAKEREISKRERREARVIERMTEKEVTDEEGRKIFPCKECDKIFKSRGSLKNHRQRIHPRRIKQCPHCPAALVGWMALRAHTVAAHPTRLSCTQCGKHFKYQHSLVKHHEMHATEEEGLQTFPCEDCGKKFKYQHSLARHRDTHLEKTLNCPDCPKKFGSSQQLRIHQRVHTRAALGPSHRCQYCAKAFYETYNLTVHERTHRNERPFSCDICHTNYGTNSSLKRHKRVSHNSAKPFECPTCHRSFTSASIRDRHVVRTHAGPEAMPFACDLCVCRYTKQKDLQKHILKVHPKTKKRSRSDSE